MVRYEGVLVCFMAEDLQKEVVAGLAKGATDLVKEVYTDTAKPVVSVVGQAAQSILRFVALPFTFLGLTAEQLEEKYKAFIQCAMKKVPKEKIVAPEPSIAAKILDEAKFVFDNEPLRKMYQELLASSIHADKKDSVHPSFLERIRGLSSYDANLIEFIFVYRKLEYSIIKVHELKDLQGAINYGSCVDLHMSNYICSADERFWLSVTLLQSFGIISKNFEKSFEQFKKVYFETWLCKNVEVLPMLDSLEKASYQLDKFFEKYPSIANTLKDVIPNNPYQYYIDNIHFLGRGFDYEISKENLQYMENILVDFKKVDRMECTRSRYILTEYGKQLYNCLRSKANPS